MCSRVQRLLDAPKKPTYPPPPLLLNSSAVTRMAYKFGVRGSRLDSTLETEAHRFMPSNVSSAVAVHCIIQDLCVHASAQGCAIRRRAPPSTLRAHIILQGESCREGVMDVHRGTSLSVLAEGMSRFTSCEDVPSGGKAVVGDGHQGLADIVLTLDAFTQCQSDIQYVYMSPLNATYPPIHVRALVANDTCHVSATILTPCFDCEGFMKRVRGVEF